MVIIFFATALAIFMDELSSLTFAPSAFGLNITILNETTTILIERVVLQVEEDVKFAKIKC
jgi:hypothetical protein